MDKKMHKITILRIHVALAKTIPSDRKTERINTGPALSHEC